MRRKEYFWSLHDTANKNQIDELRTDQVEAVFLAITKKERARWLLWREGFAQWKAFEDFPDLLKGLRNQKLEKEALPPPVPREDIRVIERESSRQIQAELKRLSLEDETEEVRGGGRYTSRFVVYIHGSKGEIFKSHTVNVSQGGLMLQHGLPSWVGKYFHAEIQFQGQQISVLCSGIKVAGSSEITRLKIEENNFQDLLRSWLITAQ